MSFIRRLLRPDYYESESLFRSVRTILQAHRSLISGGRLLDIGCGSQPFRPLFEAQSVRYEGIDFERYHRNRSADQHPPDHYFAEDYLRCGRLPQFSAGSYDLVTAFQVLEHHHDPDAFFEEAARILAPDGCLLVTTPFMYEVHLEPNDFFRFTEFQMEKFLRRHGFRLVQQIKRGNAFTTLATLCNSAVLGRHPPGIKALLWAGMLPFHLLGVMLAATLFRGNRSSRIYLGTSILAQRVHEP